MKSLRWGYVKITQNKLWTREHFCLFVVNMVHASLIVEKLTFHAWISLGQLQPWLTDYCDYEIKPRVKPRVVFSSMSRTCIRLTMWVKTKKVFSCLGAHMLVKLHSIFTTLSPTSSYSTSRTTEYQWMNDRTKIFITTRSFQTVAQIMIT